MSLEPSTGETDAGTELPDRRKVDRELQRVKWLLVVILAGLVLSMVSLGVAVKGIIDIGRAGHDARLQGCYLLRELVVDATPRGQKAAAIAFVNRTPLRDCNHYADHP